MKLLEYILGFGAVFGPFLAFLWLGISGGRSNCRTMLGILNTCRSRGIVRIERISSSVMTTGDLTNITVYEIHASGMSSTDGNQRISGTFRPVGTGTAISSLKHFPEGEDIRVIYDPCRPDAFYGVDYLKSEIRSDNIIITTTVSFVSLVLVCFVGQLLNSDTAMALLFLGWFLGVAGYALGRLAFARRLNRLLG